MSEREQAQGRPPRFLHFSLLRSNMSVVRRWARKLSRRRFQQLLVRSISACPQDVHGDLKQILVCRQGSIVDFERCRQQERGFFLAASIPISSARSVCSSTVCLHSIESAVNCSDVCHDADPPVDKVGETAQVSSHIANIDVHGMADHQSIPPTLHSLYATDGHNALALQKNADMEVENGFPQASVAMETIGSTRVTDGHHNITSTSLACRFNEDSKTLPRSKNTSSDMQDLTVGLKCDDGEDDLQENMSLGGISGSSKPVLSSEDMQTVQGICTFLDSKGWDVNTEEFLSKNYACLPHSVVSMVIHRQTRLHVANSFFEWACRKLGHASYSYHALLLKIGLNKQYDEAWELLNRMKNTGCQVSETTFCILIKAYGAARNPDMAVTAFKRMHDYGVVAGPHTFTTLISVFFKLQLIDEVHLCYYHMIVDGMNLDMHMFSTLICGFGIMGKKRDAQACFDMMLSYAYEPNLSTFNSLIQGFCCCNAMQRALSTFCTLEKMGLQPNAFTFNAIIKAFCKDGKLEDAMSFFFEMKKRDNVKPNQATYNILLQGMFAKEEFLRAIDFFKQMEREGFVDSRSYIYLSKGLCQMEQTEELLDILQGLFDLHGFSNTEICNALIYNLAHLNALDEAATIFRGMVNAQTHTSIPSYAIMISSYCRAQKLEEAIEMLAELRRKDCVPSSSCYTPIITFLLGKNRATEALRYLQEMQALGLEVNQITYEYLLKTICKLGMIEDAIKICDVMMARRFTLSAGTLFEFMKCLIKLRSIEFATSCFRRMYKQQALVDCKAVSQALAVMNLYSKE